MANLLYKTIAQQFTGKVDIGLCHFPKMGIVHNNLELIILLITNLSTNLLFFCEIKNNRQKFPEIRRINYFLLKLWISVDLDTFHKF